MGGQGLGRVAFIVMIVMVLCNSVQVQSISQCVVECQQLCAGSEDPQCAISCLKNKCDKQPPAAVYYCSLGCATYRCTNFSTSGMALKTLCYYLCKVTIDFQDRDFLQLQPLISIFVLGNVGKRYFLFFLSTFL